MKKIFIEKSNYSPEVLEMAEQVNRVICSQFSYLHQESDNKELKVDTKKLNKAVTEGNQEVIDQQVEIALMRCCSKIEMAMDELLSPSLQNVIQGAQILAIYSMFMAIALKSQDIKAIRKDLVEENVKVKSNSEAFKGLILGALETVYQLAMQKDKDNESKPERVVN